MAEGKRGRGQPPLKLDEADLERMLWGIPLLLRSVLLYEKVERSGNPSSGVLAWRTKYLDALGAVDGFPESPLALVDRGRNMRRLAVYDEYREDFGALALKRSSM